MILFIKFSGGVGVSYQGGVDLSALPDHLQRAVESSLSEENLARIGNTEKDPHAADTVIYEFHYAGSGKSFSIDETQFDDELLQLIDELRSHMELQPVRKTP